VVRSPPSWHKPQAGSELIESLVEQNEPIIAGAEYSLETGEVKFLNGIETSLK